MITEDQNYYRVEKAIHFIQDNLTLQPDLEKVAKHLDLSPFHFQKIFTEWAGVSPKKFLQFLTVEYSKDLLREQQFTLFDTAHAGGLSGTGRLHDLFVSIEGMTPAEFKNGGQDLQIDFSFLFSVFGEILIASTTRGICFMAFSENRDERLMELKTLFPNASFREYLHPQHIRALGILKDPLANASKIRLHVKGTPFQLKVWNALLNIKEGQLSTYGKISETLSLPGAARAVGTAVGSNPVAFLIPCHRVVQAGGKYGQYRWGETRKKMMIGWEAVRKNNIVLLNNDND